MNDIDAQLFALARSSVDARRPCSSVRRARASFSRPSVSSFSFCAAASFWFAASSARAASAAVAAQASPALTSPPVFDRAFSAAAA